MRDKIDAYIGKNTKYVYELAMEICKISSVTGHEENKANFIKKRINEICGKGAWIDEVGNVLYKYNGLENDRVSIYAAHIDTVRYDINDIEPVLKGNRIYAPSIWDNSINIAALIFCIKMFKDLELSLDRNILFAFDVGEEGFGNLKGIRHIVNTRKGSIDEVIALDLEYDSVANAAVGSKRYLLSIKTQGGHGYYDFGNENAILLAANIIKKLYSLEVSSSPKTTYNVGVIKGGTTVNTIAEFTEVEVELRSEDQKYLNELEEKFLIILENQKNRENEIKCQLRGQRDCGRISPNSDLLKRVTETRKELGLDIKFHVGSTDANIPLSMNIPAVSFGACNGGGAHSTEEYIDLDSLEVGLKHLMYLVMK
jgi:tripeptide aminopeptidase